MLFYKLKSYLPEIGHPDKSSAFNLGCFALSILLNVDSGIFASFIKEKILRHNCLRKGKSNFSSMF